jgi:putative effector of murein hydrolase
MGLIALRHFAVPLDKLMEEYKDGGIALKFMLGPATVALAVPLYRRLKQIRAQLAAVLGSVAVGGTIAVLVSWSVTHALAGSRDVQLAMLSRSVTTPISMGIARELGAPQEFAATFTVLSGLLGAVIGPKFLRMVGIRHDLPLGLGIGVSSHGIGTSSVIRHSEAQGAAAGLAMALNGIFTTLIMIPVYTLVHRL